MTVDQKHRFMRLACELSPENLHCDGEISNAQAATKKRILLGHWKLLEKEVGRVVTEADLYVHDSNVIDFLR